MSMAEREYTLNAAAVDAISEAAAEYMEAQGVERMNLLRIRLTMEELLLQLHREGVERCTVRMGKRLGVRQIVIRYGGAALNPVREADDWGGRLMEDLGLTPEWRFRGGANDLRFRLPKPTGRSRLFHLGIAAVLALTLGTAGNALPESVRESLMEILLTPCFNAFLGLLNTLAGLMIFSSVASGVFGIGDAAELNKIGKVMFPRFLLLQFAVALIGVTLLRPFLHMNTAPAVQGEHQISKITEMIFNILPNNPVRPFLDGNTLQIIVLAVFTGVVLLIRSEQTRTASRLIEEAGIIVSTMMSYICKLIPAFVFVSLLRQVWAGLLGQMLGLWKPLALFTLMELVITAMVLLLYSLRARMSPIRLLRLILPPAIVGFTTASSMAAFSLNMETCHKKLGIHRKFMDFSLPICLVLYKPGILAALVTVAMYLAELYGVETSPAWLFTAAVVSTLLAIAVPIMPGCMLTCYGILMTQLHIPTEGMILAAALDLFLDLLATGFDLLQIDVELLREAEILGETDRSVLHPAGMKTA